MSLDDATDSVIINFRRRMTVTEMLGTKWKHNK
jgi:hypothetical protein